MLFKSDTMNALVACNLLDEGYDLNESLEALDSYSFLLEEGRSGELYSLVLWEGNRLDEAHGTTYEKKRAGRATARADKANRQRNQAEQDAADERTHGEAETARADAAERQSAGNKYLAAKKAKKEAGQKAAVEIAKTRGERDTARGEAADERQHGEAETATG